MEERRLRIIDNEAIDSEIKERESDRERFGGHFDVIWDSSIWLLDRQ